MENYEDEKVRLSLSVPKKLFDKIEILSKESFLGRSAWIIQAINDKIILEEKSNN